jgi:hypothetical protein
MIQMAELKSSRFAGDSDLTNVLNRRECGILLTDRRITEAEEPLGVSCTLKPLQAPLSLTGGLRGVFGAIVQIAVLSTFDTREGCVLDDDATGERQIFDIPVAQVEAEV